MDAADRGGCSIRRDPRGILLCLWISAAIRSPILKVISCFTYAADKVSPYWLRTLSVLPPPESVLCPWRPYSHRTASVAIRLAYILLLSSFRLLLCSSRSSMWSAAALLQPPVATADTVA